MKELYTNKNKTGNYFPIKFMVKVLTWLSRVVKTTPTEITSLLKVLDKIATVYNTRGKSECIRYCKDLRKRFIAFISQEPNGVQSVIPSILRPFKGKTFSSEIDYPLMRLILSTTYLSRFIRLKPSPSFDSITKGPGYTGTPSDIEPFVRDFLQRILGVNPKHFGNVPKALSFKRFHMTSKSGPTGLHALWSAYTDVMNIPSDLKQSIKIVGGEKLYSLMDRFSSLYQRIPRFFESYGSHESVDFRKIAIIKDKEGKTREVAILDYYSQSALRPLHNFLFAALKRINQDCTHDQHKLIRKLVPRKGSRFHSIDLTTATDRFPICIEKLILSTWFGKHYADAWEHIMIGYPFRYQDRMVTYGTGNPMGAYSSWATFAIAHHLFVYIACRKANRNFNRCPYMLLGDDIVIADDEVAKEYKELLTEWDIPFSEEKSHSSTRFYEFAKQLILDNENVSPFPTAALYERRNSLIESISIIVRELSYKDWDSDIWDQIESYLVIVRGFTYPKVREYKPKINLAIALMFYLQGKDTLGTAIKEYVRSLTRQPVSWPKWTTDMYSQYIAGNVVTDMFDVSRERISKFNGKPLGELATEMVCHITGLFDGGVDCFDLIESVPFLQIYGRAEETYLKILKPTIGARLIRDGAQMRAALEVIDIPLSDQDFYLRHRDVIIIKALKASKSIRKIIKLHMSRNPRFNTKPITGAYY
jgi:hypothetical protein